MPLSGHSSDLSLADLVQANIYGRNTCRVLVATPQGHGVFFLSDGAIVDARFGDLAGSEAFCALVNAENAHFRVDSGIRCPSQTIHEDWQKLLLDAMRLKDEGKVPKPQGLVPPRNGRQAGPTALDRVGSGSPSAGGRDVLLSFADSAAPPGPVNAGPGRDAQRTAVPAGSREQATEAGAQRRRRGSPLVILVPVLAVAIAVVAYLTAGHRTGEGLEPSKAPASGSVETVEVTALTGQGDVPPQFLAGQTPRSPNSALAVAPTVVCRILVDEKGTVADAKIFRSRLDLASFEDAALEAVRSYRFNPGLRAGRPVRVWVNWPVSFQ